MATRVFGFYAELAGTGCGLLSGGVGHCVGLHKGIHALEEEQVAEVADSESRTTRAKNRRRLSINNLQPIPYAC